jgi:hypothetical protein
MNKNTLLTALLLLITLILTACTSSKSSTPTESTGKLPAQTQLILGTIRLEETDYAVTTEQAAQLLPMWYVLQDLNESGSAAQEEIDGLVNQIQKTMTDDQINSITDMGLTREDMVALMQGSGGETNSAKPGSTSNVTGGGPGGPPPDMPGGLPGMGFSGTTSTTSESSLSTSQTNSTPSALFDLVIELLQKKV